MRMAGRTVPLEVELWRNGTLASLPDALGHAVLGAWQEPGVWVEAMEDLSDNILSCESRVSRDDFRRLFAAANDLHETFRDAPVEGLWSWDRRLTVFAPDVLEPYAAARRAMATGLLGCGAISPDGPAAARTARARSGAPRPEGR